MLFYDEVVETAQVALTSTGDKYTFTPSTVVEVVRWGIVADALLDVGAGLTVAADYRPTAGSDTGRVDADIGSVTTAADIAQGKVWNDELASPYKLIPGEQAVFEVTDAADTAGTGILYIHYRRRPWHPELTDYANVTEG